MTSELEATLNEIDPTRIDPAELAALTSEQEFVGIAVDLLIEVDSYVCVAASVLPGDTNHWNRDQAIVGGHLVRLYKLISAVIDQTCQHRSETTFILARLVFEAIVNLRYMIKRASTSLFDSYVRFSLRHEKKLYDTINANIADRNGEELPIERRMLNSIERAARNSEIDLADVSSSRPRNWGDKNLFERAEEVELSEVYLGTFGGPSHNVHGNWMDLLDYHLEATDLGFRPRLEWKNPRPQVLFAIATLATEAVGEYFHYLAREDIFQFSDRKLADLWRRIRTADEAHENFIISRVDG